MRTPLSLALLVLLIAGCDAAGEADRPAVVSGTVTSLSTGQPLVGITVGLRSSGFAGLPLYGTTATDAGGRFELSAASAEDPYHLFVNEEPYDPSVYTWASFNDPQPLGRDMDIRVWEIAGLVVYAETDTPLGEGDRAFVQTPCVGSIFVPVRSGCAKANAENEVVLTVRRGDETTVRRERIYTPLGETTVVRWTY